MFRSEIRTNQGTTRVMRHKCFWTDCQTFLHLTTFASSSRQLIIIINVNPDIQAVNS